MLQSGLTMTETTMTQNENDLEGHNGTMEVERFQNVLKRTGKKKSE